MAKLIKGNKQYALILDEEEAAFVAAMADIVWNRNGVTTAPDDTIWGAFNSSGYYDHSDLYEKYRPKGNTTWSGE